MVDYGKAGKAMQSGFLGEFNAFDARRRTAAALPAAARLAMALGIWSAKRCVWA